MTIALEFPMRTASFFTGAVGLDIGLERKTRFWERRISDRRLHMKITTMLVIAALLVASGCATMSDKDIADTRQWNDKTFGPWYRSAFQPGYPPVLTMKKWHDANWLII